MRVIKFQLPAAVTKVLRLFFRGQKSTKKNRH